ncbi:MAG: YraN family protein [Bacteroidetes bacterium]|nr:YraN family protein [Bacteroidota bacterium]
MSVHIETGKTGEQLATDHLLAKGYKILERNWRWGREELDIIAQDGNFVVIVEVKTRTGKNEIEPAEVVPRDKQRILVRIANAYMRYKNLPGEVRFDIITILMNARGRQLHHLEDAFYATL